MIEIVNAHKEYRAGESVVRALNGISLEMAKGEFVSIAGPSGSGKTTLLNMIGCIDSLTAGDVYINNQRVGGMSSKERTLLRRRSIGFIFQSFNLIPVLTVEENVSMALALLRQSDADAKQKTRELLALVGLAGLERRRPAELSGGQQQRVAVARALVKRPLIVLADEPTANLDSENGRAILTLMQELNQTYQVTFIFSTHDQMVMDCARRLVVLHDGRIQMDKTQ